MSLLETLAVVQIIGYVILALVGLGIIALFIYFHIHDRRVINGK